MRPIIRHGRGPDGSVTTLAGSPAPCMVDCSCATPPTGGYAEGTGAQAQFSGPYGVAYHVPSRSLFVVDAANYVIRRIQ